MKYRKINDEVYYPDKNFVMLSVQDIAFFKSEAQKNLRHRVRLCAHQSVNDKIHEMFIVHTREAYVRPHKHLNRTESFYVIEGALDVILFDDEGNETKRIEMGEINSGKQFYYRLSEPIYHTFRIKSDLICFYEVTNGPFDPKGTAFPSWAPDGSNEQEAKTFMDRFRKH